MLGEIRTARGLSPGKAKKKGGSKMSENKIEMGRAELSVKMDESGTAPGWTAPPPAGTIFWPMRSTGRFAARGKTERGIEHEKN